VSRIPTGVYDKKPSRRLRDKFKKYGAARGAEERDDDFKPNVVIHGRDFHSR